VLARQQLYDGRGFAMPPQAQHDALIGPFHRCVCLSSSPRDSSTRHCERSEAIPSQEESLDRFVAFGSSQ
jgi:hypothetical protein